MISHTRDKLLEARYFLECMKEKHSNPDAFKFNLSAFLAAARSVTLFMQKQFDKAPGFKEWYANKQSGMRSDEIMKLLHRKRVTTIHRESLRPHPHIVARIDYEVIVNESISIVTAYKTTEKSEWESAATGPVPVKTKVITEWRWYFNEVPEKDIVTICEEHIVKLETLVAECEFQFTS